MRRFLPCLLLLACETARDLEPPPTPLGTPASRSELLRDFYEDGKHDEAGRPLSAHVTEVDEVCSGEALEDGVRLDEEGCEGPLAGSAQAGDLTLDVRIRAQSEDPDPEAVLATVEVLDDEAVLASTTLTVSGLREGEDWMHVSVQWPGRRPANVRITPGSGEVTVGGLEVFKSRFRLALGPGSMVLTPEDRVAIEWPLDAPRPQVELAGEDVSAAVEALLEAGDATESQTSYRQLLDVPVGALLATLPETPESGSVPLVARTLRPRPECRSV